MCIKFLKSFPISCIFAKLIVLSPDFLHIYQNTADKMIWKNLIQMKESVIWGIRI